MRRSMAWKDGLVRRKGLTEWMSRFIMTKNNKLVKKEQMVCQSVIQTRKKMRSKDG